MSEEKIMGFEEILGNEMVKDHFKKAILTCLYPDGRSRHGKKIDRECVCDDAPVRERRK